MDHYLIFEIDDDGVYGRFFADTYENDESAVEAAGRLTDRPSAVWCHGTLIATLPRNAAR